MFPITVHAQSVDCSLQQSQVNDLTSEINNAQAALTQAQDKLSKCQNIENVVKSDEFQAALADIKQNNEKSQLEVLLPQAHTNGVNWNDINQYGG